MNNVNIINISCFVDCRWDIRCVRKNKIIWEIKDKKNIMTNEGRKAWLDTFWRNNGANYFGMTNFYVGLYKGSISASTTLVTVPEISVSYGYSRLVLERSTVGWPTIELDSNRWRVVSKELSYEAVNGNIGPLNGAFVCTSSDNTGTLINAVSTDVEREILAGDIAFFTLKVKIK